ncbi:hypothetical protein [Lentilitoribacter sp. EG35]|uniref:hypothetical protein n=1 Tax=Lentilitoribacter sp. EG35 TaxID=3234192 RepID=UPI0034605AC0
MPEQKPKKTNPIVWVVMICFSWLGLAGLADNVVEWREWFDAGVIQHWRNAQRWALEHLLFWLPFQLPIWIFDYLTIGIVFGRAFVVAMLEMESENDEFRIHQRNIREKFEFMVGLVILVFLWPLVLMLYGFMGVQGLMFLNHRDSDFADIGKLTVGTFKWLIYSMLASVPVLFVLTDFIKTFS